MTTGTRNRPRTQPRVPSGPVDGGWSHRPLSLGDVPKRGAILLVATAIVLTLFAGRLVELQVFRGQSLASAALDQRLRTAEIPAQRGMILDSAGDPLAVTVEARNVTADQTFIDDPAAAAARLAPILGMDSAELVTRLTGDRRLLYLEKTITTETWNRIDDLDVPGIFSEITSRRVYPGGELAAMCVVDAVARLLPGVLGDLASPIHESFSDAALLEYPQYTRPRVWRDHEVPEILLSGNHAKIEAWRLEERLKRTRLRRPDLLPPEPAAGSPRRPRG